MKNLLELIEKSPGEEWVNLIGEKVEETKGKKKGKSLVDQNIGVLEDFGKDVVADVLKDITEAIEKDGVGKGFAVGIVRKSIYKLVKVHLPNMISKLVCTSKPDTLSD